MRIGITTQSAVCEIRKYSDHVNFRQRITGDRPGAGVMIFAADNTGIDYHWCRDSGGLKKLHCNFDREIREAAAAVVVHGSETDFDFLSRFHDAMDEKIEDWNIYEVKVTPQRLDFAYSKNGKVWPVERIRVDDFHRPLSLMRICEGTNGSSIRIMKFNHEMDLELLDAKGELTVWGKVWYDECGWQYVERNYPIQGTAEELQQLASADRLRDQHGYYYCEF